MLYCPYCGIKVHDDEIYCLKCGNEIPRDLDERVLNKQRKFNKIWLVPIAISLLFLVSTISLHLFLQNKTVQAEQFYEQGEDSLANGQYDQSKHFFEEAIHLKPNFIQAVIALEFVTTALNIQNDIDTANTDLEQQEFQNALLLINEAEHELRNYHGHAATELIDELVINRHKIKLKFLRNELDENPTIDDLKVLLWEAKAINMKEAESITENIRNQIIDYTFSKASEQLNKHQFTDAQTLVNDGLKYAINSEKLLSLQTTIKKEKEAFETAQQERIEQAIDIAEEEREVNELEAVDLEHAELTRDEQGMLVVSGEIKSVATIPVNSVIVEYSLTDEMDEEIITNNVFVFPDKLYPDEIGKFEFTHYDIDERMKNIDIQINKITWYTE